MRKFQIWFVSTFYLTQKNIWKKPHLYNIKKRKRKKKEFSQRIIFNINYYYLLDPIDMKKEYKLKSSIIYIFLTFSFSTIIFLFLKKVFLLTHSMWYFRKQFQIRLYNNLNTFQHTWKVYDFDLFLLRSSVRLLTIINILRLPFNSHMLSRFTIEC